MQLVHYQLAILKVKIRKVYSVTDETEHIYYFLGITYMSKRLAS